MADLSDPDVGTAYYRSKDPFKNLQIRVYLERVTSSSLVPQAVDTETSPSMEMKDMKLASAPVAQKDAEEMLFRWQQKVFSPREVETYSNEANCFDVLEKKYHIDVQQVLKNGKPQNRLFSCVDHDNFTNEGEDVQYMTSSPNEEASVLATKMAQVRRRRLGGRKVKESDSSRIPKINIVDIELTVDKRNKNHTMTAPIQIMHIMADLSPRERLADINDEAVLCTIQIDANGVLVMRPDFNKGKQAYIIETGGVGKDVFEYTIEHMSKGMNRQEQDRENKMYRELYIRHREFLQSSVGYDFEIPPPGVLRVLIYGEIESTRNFDYDDLYLHFFVDLPKHWFVERSQQLAWVTQRCRTQTKNRDDVAYFSYPFSLELFYQDDSVDDESKDLLPRFPSFLFEVLSLDSWQRFRTEGYSCLPIPTKPGSYKETIHCWRPTGSTVSAELRRFFIGGSSELEDPTYTAFPSTFEGSHLSKFGFRTATTGSISLNLNIIMQSRAFMERKSNRKSVGTLLDNLGMSAVQANIASVLEAFKKSRQRMMMARDSATKELMKDV